jgi:hypothetical protein
MSLVEFSDTEAGSAGAALAPDWLACTPSLARAGLRATPHPPPGAARGQPPLRGALAPPCASLGDTARQTGLPRLRHSRPARDAVTAFHESH